MIELTPIRTCCRCGQAIPTGVDGNMPTHYWPRQGHHALYMCDASKTRHWEVAYVRVTDDLAPDGSLFGLGSRDDVPPALVDKP
jgi:hypothetical protein